MGEQQWTIQRIHDALGNPQLASRFLGEINRAPAHELLSVFAKWQQIAKSAVAAARRGRDLAQYDLRGEQPPGQWIDGTDRVLDGASSAHHRGVA